MHNVRRFSATDVESAFCAHSQSLAQLGFTWLVSLSSFVKLRVVSLRGSWLDSVGMSVYPAENVCMCE